MTDLIKALEEAEKGSRDLNIGLGQALGLIDEDLIYTSPDGSRSGRGNCDPWRDWTGSLDAAISLASRVRPGCRWQISSDQESDGFWGQVRNAPPYTTELRFNVTRQASTPALALCAAILKAASDEGAGR